MCVSERKSVSVCMREIEWVNEGKWVGDKEWVSVLVKMSEWTCSWGVNVWACESNEWAKRWEWVTDR